MMEMEHVILSERPEDQYKAVEWAKREHERILQEKSKQIAVELRKEMAPMIKKSREARRVRTDKMISKIQ